MKIKIKNKDKKWKINNKNKKWKIKIKNEKWKKWWNFYFDDKKISKILLNHQNLKIWINEEVRNINEYINRRINK